MTQSAVFSSGIELASSVTSSVLLCKSWDVITSRFAGIVSNVGEGISWKVYREPGSDLTIIAFEVTQDISNLQVDLVPSNALGEKIFHHFKFLCTKKAPLFYVNSTAISLLDKNYEKLDQLKSEINSSTPLIVTGLGLGGSLASLFTISLLDSIRLGKNRLLCITFGSPLIGDNKLQQAISRSPIWNSCFLHVVSLKDPLPRLFITNHSSSATALSNAYTPFGTFFFCSDVNSTCFENPDSIIKLLIALGSMHVQNQGFRFIDYGNTVENLNHKAICNDLTTQAENMPIPKSNSLFARSISLQLRALGLTPCMQQQQQQQNIDINKFETKMEKLEEKFIMQQRVLSNPSKKLNQMKEYLTELEWYKLETKSQGIGYYDSYKNMDSPRSQEVYVFYRRLTDYWEKLVEEAKIRPQKASAAFRQSWIYAGTSYRRMVEPLAIAHYYRDGGKDYVTKNRPEHFVLLEEWFRHEASKGKTSKVEAILTLENCYFWECVEEALLSRQQSMVVKEMEDNFSIISEENDEAISTLCSSLWARVDQLLLSSKELKVVIENEENLNTTSKNNDHEENSCFGARVDGFLLSRQGSTLVAKEKEENIKRFGLCVEEALLSRQESIAIKENEEKLNRARKKNAEAILTIDSCFWAHVEEAHISCKELKIIKEKEETLKKLVEFEEYVYRLLKNYELSPDIFLPQSSYMCWWNEYKAIKGTSYNSKLASFMNDEKHELYALGDYDFP